MVLLVAGLAGCLGSPVPAPSGLRTPLSKAVEAWDFQGHQGAIHREVPDVGWVHLVVPLTSRQETSNFSFEVRWDFGSQDNTPLRNFFWFGLSLDGPESGLNGAGSVAAYADRDAAGSDAYVEALGERHGLVYPITLPDPLYEAPSYPTVVRWHFGTDTLKSVLKNAAAGNVHHPVLQAFIMMDGFKPGKPVVIEGAWTDTIAEVSYGPRGDNFVRSLNDFTATARVGADAGPLHAAVGKDYRLRLPLGEAGKATAFSFYGMTDVAGNRFTPHVEASSYTRPDGTVERPDGGEGLEFSRQSGRWTFDIPDDSLIVNSNLPPLWGTVYTPARLPWQT